MTIFSRPGQRISRLKMMVRKLRSAAGDYLSAPRKKAVKDEGDHFKFAEFIEAERRSLTAFEAQGAPYLKHRVLQKWVTSVVLNGLAVVTASG